MDAVSRTSFESNVRSKAACLLPSEQIVIDAINRGKYKPAPDVDILAAAALLSKKTCAAAAADQA
jgi:hypothetical protein